MISIGNDELKECEILGDFILCDKCGERHKITTWKSEDGFTSISTYKCGVETYMAGIDGKDIRSRFKK